MNSKSVEKRLAIQRGDGAGPQIFEAAIAEAFERAMSRGRGVQIPEWAELLKQTDLLLCFCKVVWESNEDLRRRVAELEKRDRERVDDHK